MSIAPDRSPEAYAKHLAGYIRDPSTIRARTLDYFGRAPALARISHWRAEAERSKANAYPPVGEAIAPPPEPKPVVVAFTPPKLRPLRGRCADDMIREVARSFCLTVEDIRGQSRRLQVCSVRHLAAKLLSDGGSSAAQVGRWINREHSSVSHSLRVFPHLAQRNDHIALAYVHFRKAWGLG